MASEETTNCKACWKEIPKGESWCSRRCFLDEDRFGIDDDDEDAYVDDN